jgi:hypothetical protein
LAPDKKIIEHVPHACLAKFAWLRQQPCRVGFYGDAPSLSEVVARCQGQAFLNFDDNGWGPGTTVFLHDFDRPAERAFAERYLKRPDEQYGKSPMLAVFRYALDEDDRLSAPNASKQENSAANA